MRLDHPPVGGHRVAGLQHQHVTDRQLGRRSSDGPGGRRSSLRPSRASLAAASADDKPRLELPTLANTCAESSAWATGRPATAVLTTSTATELPLAARSA
jgi:hypothetical protein